MSSPEPDGSVGIDDLTGRGFKDMFDEIDREYRAASEALAREDWPAWIEHAGRGAELFEKIAHLNGWRD